MDVVYRIGPHKPELRYSLRSLVNIDHDRVWIVAETLPAWAQNVQHLPVADSRGKQRNLITKMQAVADCDDITENFILVDDDMFALHPTTVPVWYRGALKAEKPRTQRNLTYRESVAATGWLLDQLGHQKRSYELHVPMMFNRPLLAEALALTDMEIQVRSLYGNVHQIGGGFHQDVKIGNTRTSWQPGQTWVSTSDRSFSSGAVGKELKQLFGELSPYEKEGPVHPQSHPSGRVVARRRYRHKPDQVKLDTGEWVDETETPEEQDFGEEE